MAVKRSVLLILMFIVTAASLLSAKPSHLANADGEFAREGSPSVPALSNESGWTPPTSSEERSSEEILKEYGSATVLVLNGTLVKADPSLVEVLVEALEAIGAPSSCSGDLSVQLVLRSNESGVPTYVSLVECKGVVYKVTGPLGKPLVELASDYEVSALMALSEETSSAASYAVASQGGGLQKAVEPESPKSEEGPGNNNELERLLFAAAVPVCAAAATYAIVKRLLS